jgi:hypothetical protein
LNTPRWCAYGGLPRSQPLRDIADHVASVGFPDHHPPMRSFLGGPIQVAVRVSGNLCLTDKQGADEFTNDDEELVQALAAAAAVAIENATLLAESRHRHAWRTTMVEVTTQLLGDADPDEVLRRLVHHGALLGWTQAIVLRQVVTSLDTDSWIRATVLGAMLTYAMGMLPSLLFPLPVPAMIATAAIAGMVLLCSIGAAQWRVLRRHRPDSAWWIPVTAGAWLLGPGAFPPSLHPCGNQDNPSC